MKHTIIMAPLQGFTDRTFRQVFACHFKGVDSAVAPFISTMSQHKIRSSRLHDVKIYDTKGFPVIPQILGNNADDFIFLAGHLFETGHAKLNWNLGCPHLKVAKKLRGSGLLPYPEKVDRLLDNIIPRIKSTLSVKLRLGRHDPEEIFNLLPVLEKYPLDNIIVHPRTGVQMYEGAVNHDFFGRILQLAGHPLIYNGDITDVGSFMEIRKKFPAVQTVMIGRGLLSNPFLAEEIKALNIKGNRKQRFIRFHDHLLEAYHEVFSGPGHLIGRMKGFWTFFGPSFTHSPRALKKILKASSMDSYKNGVADFFRQDFDFRKSFFP